jgi:hypothetical protein
VRKSKERDEVKKWLLGETDLSLKQIDAFIASLTIKQVRLVMCIIQYAVLTGFLTSKQRKTLRREEQRGNDVQKKFTRSS